MKTPFKKRGISRGPLNGFVPARIGNRTESERDSDSVPESKQDTDSGTGVFFPARSSTAGESVLLPLGVTFGSKKGTFLSSSRGQKGDFLSETSLVEFSLPLNRHRERDFFFLGDDDELKTGAAETGASARERDVRAFSRDS